MSVPDPFLSPEIWDQFVMVGGGGRATIMGVSKVTVKTGILEDVVEIPNSDGATYTLLNYRPAEVTVDIQLWEPEQFNKFSAIIAAFRPQRNGGKPNVIDAIHPQCSLNGIKSVYIFDIETNPPTAKDGYTASIHLREWHPTFTAGRRNIDSGNGGGGVRQGGSIADERTIRSGGPVPPSAGGLEP